MVDAEKLYLMILDTRGNPSTKDLCSIGYSDRMAQAAVLRMASLNVSPLKLMHNAARLLRDNYGVRTYKGIKIEDYMQ